MGMEALQIHDSLDKVLTVGLFDDFLTYSDTVGWTKLVADGGASAVAVADGAKGVLTMVSGSTDNDEVAVKSNYESFLIADGKPILGQALIQFSEVATNKANVAFGFADAWGANLLVDDGAGPKTSFSGALIFKVDGGTAWKTCSSKSTTQTITTSSTTAGGSAYQKLRIEIRPVSSTLAEVCYFVDNQQLRDSTYNRLIKDTITYTSATEMQIGCYLKSGSAASETLLVDYIAAEMRR